ncbi:MAG: hypothetical protein H7831_15100 [Magnetococcus sp. WYHC-3]
MSTFIEKFAGKVTGKIECFDRVIFKGHLMKLAYAEGMEKFVARQGLRIADFGRFAQTLSERLVLHAKSVAAKHRRPYQYLPRRIRKDDEARKVAERDGIRNGLVCVFAELECCPTFKIAYGQNRPHIQFARRKCLCLYYYFLHPELGLIHVRLQTWMPFVVQIAVNGHDWLAAQMKHARISFEQADNAFVQIGNFNKAQQLADGFCRLDWPTKLAKLTEFVNPLLDTVLKGQQYYWTVDQAEFATDILFHSRQALGPLYRELIKHALLCFSAQDVLGFLGKKLTGNFKADVMKDFKTRVEGMRIKHRVGRNWIKMYDKFGLILRIETVINDPYGFLIRRHGVRQGKRVIGWFPMTKGVTGLPRFAQVARSANSHYLAAISVADDPAPAQELLRLCTRRVQHDQHSYRGFNPGASEDIALFKAILQGQHHLHGFRNANVRAALYPHTSTDLAASRRLAGRIRRQLKRLHVRSLIARIPHSRRWRVTDSGHAFMGMAIKHHDEIYLTTLHEKAA